MKTIDIYNDQIFDLLKMGKLESIDSLYDLLETELEKGFTVRFFAFYEKEGQQPIISFNNILTFMDWRKKRKAYAESLLNLFNS